MTRGEDTPEQLSYTARYPGAGPSGIFLYCRQQPTVGQGADAMT